MINKNLSLNGNTKNQPFLLKPAAKDYLWGGNRLNDDFSKEIKLNPLAETWECSTHPDGASTAACGEFEGKTLTEILNLHPNYLGTHPDCKNGFPILIKLIDAKEALSVQVHPDDKYAMQYENGQSGKTEMWYILDAAPESELVYGLCHDVSREVLQKSIVEGTVEKLLQKVKVKKDDVFYIETGTIHAIGAGILIAEIQENSNLTYRLYDYNRMDKKGRKRELHVDKAVRTAYLKGSELPKQPLRVLKYQQGCAMELLCRCKYFEVHRMMINTERCRQMVTYHADSTSFRVLLCTEGCGSIIWKSSEVTSKNEMIHFFKGDCIFVPADSVWIKIHGRAQMLDVRG